jgi:5,10-methylene-tetrahydrofolate dehydrogenase/methenyl tetrahydrofolate cyclohydrolase
MQKTVDPAELARSYIEEVRREVQEHLLNINVLGLIASTDRPSLSYARATQKQFDSVGIHYDLRHIERLDLEQAIEGANEDPDIHGIFIYFPVFHGQHDSYLRNLVDYRKDIEAGSTFWTKKIYVNERFAFDTDASSKALLPCTPLAIVKILTQVGRYADDVNEPLQGKTVTIFNRSEVIGRPLAMMMSNDGARVYSFDINGPLEFKNAVPSETDIDRATALSESDIIITGVPSDLFEKIGPEEIRQGAICVNFSSVNNFSDEVANCAEIYIPRVGPMTVAMCMRNTVRLFHHFHGDRK